MKIAKQNVEDVLSLFPMQEGILFQYLLNPESVQYFEQLSLHLSGKLQSEYILEAWKIISEANEILRTVFRWEKLAKPVQLVLKSQELSMKKYDLSLVQDECTQLKLLEKIKAKDRTITFDLENGPLFRLIICKLAHNRFVMIISNHHILYDGWSNGIILQEFFRVYNQLLQGEKPQIQYKHKLKEYLKWAQNQDKSVAEKYWSQYLGDFSRKSSLPGSNRKVAEITRASHHILKLPTNFSSRLEKLVQQKQLTLGTVMYTCWGILLQRYTDSRDVVFGVTVSGRPAAFPGIEEMVGLFINTLPLRITTSGEETLSDLMHSIGDMMLKSSEFVLTPLQEIKSRSGIDAKESLFDSLVVLENYPLDQNIQNQCGALQLLSYSNYSLTNFDMVLGITAFDCLEIDFSYNPELFSVDTIEHLARHFLQILYEFVGQPEKRLREVEILAAEERLQILEHFNQTEISYEEKTVLQMFAEQVEKTPEASLIFHNNVFTYSELNLRANQLSRVLKKRGICQEKIIGLVLERSPELIIGMLAVWKAGGAFLTIDPDYPTARIRLMLEECKVSNLLIKDNFLRDFTFLDVIELTDSRNYSEETNTPELINRLEDLAYVIYTSGSTGKPKGVMIEHQGIANTLSWRKAEYCFTPADRVLQLFSPIFDGFLTSFFTPLISGAEIILLDKDEARDPLEIVRVIANRKVTSFIVVPSLYASILESLTLKSAESLRLITLAGENVRPDLISRSEELNTTLEIINEYGPTENSIATTIARKLKADLPITIGKPISNTCIYLLDQENCLVPIGVVGELCISGVGLARGYLHQAELTAEKFTTNPFRSGKRLYHTGDLARWLPDGRLEFLGRKDEQVKIRGFRIEPGEIETKLLSHPAIKATAVSIYEDKHGQYLTAYVVFYNEVTSEELTVYLQEELPAYMIPQFFVSLEELPLTPGGKLDRKALPEPPILRQNDFVPPGNLLEEQLAVIWKEVLNLESVGVTEDFFRLGGHSLKATTFVAKVHKILDIEIPVREVFHNSTIRGLAAYISKKVKSPYTAIKQAVEQEYYPVSSAQKRIYIESQFRGNRLGYNIPALLLLQGELDQQRLKDVFTKLIARHESLRTVFTLIDGQPVQYILTDVSLNISYYQDSKKTPADIFALCVKPFDLGVAPLLRIDLIERAKDEYYLFFDMHHIISDAISMEILIKELVSLYEGRELPVLPLHYKDFTIWQNNFFTTAEFSNQEKYWLESFHDGVSVLDLPTDYPRMKVRDFSGGMIKFSVDRKLTKQLNQLVLKAGATQYMLLVAAFSVLLAKYSNQEDILIGSPSAGRSNADLENIIGMFVNTLVLRSAPKGAKVFAEFLQEVKDVALKAYENQEYQFEMLVDLLLIEREANRNPLFDAMFVLQNAGGFSPFALKGLHITQLEFENSSTNMDLLLIAVQEEDYLQFSCKYPTDLFKRETIQRLTRHYRNILQQIVEKPQIKIRDIEIMTPEEKILLLTEFMGKKTDDLVMTIHQMFSTIAVRNPENVAITFAESVLDYHTLDEKSNQLAQYLHKSGINREEIVGIMVDRSCELAIAVLAVLKAGAAYLPLDPEYPEERLRFMLTDSACRFLLTTGKELEFSGQVIDLCAREIYQGANLVSIENIVPGNLAYIIYTSGSTGQPKGVMVEHHSVINYICWRIQNYGLTKEDVTLQLISFSFDGFGANFYGSLLSGGNLILPTKNKDYQYIIKLIDEKGVTNFSVVPGMYQAILELATDEDLQTLRFVVLAAEEAKSSLIELSQNRFPQILLINEYGPTENSITTTVYRGMQSNKTGIIGKPIANERVYILNNYDQLVPPGIRGELCIAGEGLARGYLNRPELTFEHFPADPFFAGELMYRTGDLARWHSDGNLEILGRLDEQIKIRGFRIEIGEIENRLKNHPAVRDAAVRTWGEIDPYLAAYLVGAQDSEAQIRKYLVSELPDYMHPVFYIWLPELPHLPNGKIAKNDLPKPHAETETSRAVEVLTRTEVRLQHLWTQVLDIEPGLDENFFELGGHSLKATILAGKVAQEFNIVIPIDEIFNLPTIRELAKYVDTAAKENYIVINKVIPQDYYPVSSAQKRIFLLEKSQEVKESYNIPTLMTFEGRIDIARFADSLQKLVKRHEAFRTSFVLIAGEPVQLIDQDVEFALEYREVAEDQVTEVIDDLIRPFDLQKAPLIRAALLKTPLKYYFFCDLHHIIADGSSIDLLIQDFIRLYQGENLEELHIQYKDFAVWQNQFLLSEMMQKEEAFWIDALSGELPVLNLPTDYRRPAVLDYTGDRFYFELNSIWTEKLKVLARQNEATLYMVILATFNILLAKYTAEEEIVIGSPIAGRHHADLEKIIGMFVNTLAVRNYPSGEQTFLKFLQDVRKRMLESYENQDYPFEILIEKIQVKRDMSRNPIFDVIFVMQNATSADFSLPGVKVTPVRYVNKIAKFDLTLLAEEKGSVLGFELEYRTSLFKENTIHRLADHFLTLLCEVITDPKKRLLDLQILTVAEKQEILEEFNDTRRVYPRTKSLNALFEEQVERTPENIALGYAGQYLTYQELNVRANQLAHLLRTKGVKKDQAIGLVGEKSLETIIALLAIVKAGGAYLPIEEDYPKERIEYMLKDSAAPFLLLYKANLSGIVFNGEIICLSVSEYFVGTGENLVDINTSEDLAYIIYTSGSTGKPKGVMVEHRNIIRLVKNSNMLQINSTDRILQTGALAFDASTFEIWGTLQNGATLYLLDKSELLSASKLEKWLKDLQITMIWLTSPFFNQLVEENPATFARLKTLIVGGDVLSVYHINQVRAIYPDLTIINGYGPTENTTFTTYFTIDRQYFLPVPIGRPLSNTRVYILDKFNNLCPIGIPGELCAAGDGVARGYVGLPDLTAEKFIPDPFYLNERMYRTGDLARWLEDGNIEFLGRVDRQVKIRGFRIEPGEIEAKLASHPAVKEVLVMESENPLQGKYLIAYLILSEKTDINAIKAYLAKELPGYMIPAYFILLEKFPLTANGKIDHSALLKLEPIQCVERNYLAPSGIIEQKMADLWSEILGVSNISVLDNFFDLGGHSLKATQLAARVDKEFFVELPLREIFKTPTIKELAAYITSAETKAYVAIENVPIQEFYELSSAQKRLYVLAQMNPADISYNIPEVLQVEGNLDLEKLHKAFAALIERHETLRTSFTLLKGEPVQKVHDRVEFAVEVQTGQVEVEKFVEEFVRPFDLSKPPLMRVGLIQHASCAFLIFDMHHIISDGHSCELLTEELVRLYQGQKLPQLRIQYKDFAVWQNNCLNSAELKRQENYWLKTLSGDLPVLNLPIDYKRPRQMNSEGDVVGFFFDQELSTKLNELSCRSGATIFMILLAAYNILLAKYSGQEDIIVGTPIAGRHHADLEKIIGMFVNILVLRNYPAGEKTFNEFLGEVKESALAAYENQEYQFEMLVEKLHLQRDLSRSPLFDTVFVLQNLTKTETIIGDLQLTPYEFPLKTSKFDLNLIALERNGEITFKLQYCSRLFRRETILRFVGHFIELVRELIKNPEVKLAQAQILSAEEQASLLQSCSDTKATYPQSRVIHQFYTDWVSRQGSKKALSCGEIDLTYQELHEASNRLAQVLHEHGVIADTIVGIILERSIEMVIAILAILKAGGAYLPIDPEYPRERKEFMLKDSTTNLVISQKEYLYSLDFAGIWLDINGEKILNADNRDLSVISNPGGLAYIIYTSGSTGQPKGVMVEHHNVVRLLFNDKFQFTFTSADVWTIFHSFSFDFSVWEMYGALLYGGKAIIVPRLIAQSPPKFLKLLSEEKVTVLNQTPTAFYNLLAEEAKAEEKKLGLRYIIFGGEALKPLILKTWRERYPETKLINMYGITETTVHVTFKEITEREIELNESNIGRPIPTLTTYIFDKQHKLVPLGVAGELCVGGEGVARGYLRRPDLTAERFIINPYNPTERLYCSGDLVRMLPSREMEYLGRIDRQVKIRGFRVELGEIEKILLKHDEVRDAVVVDHEEGDEKYLCAYLVTNRELGLKELRSYLACELPDYMIPARFISIDQLPLTANGKIDLRALPSPTEVKNSGKIYTPPRTELEARLVQIWHEVLQSEKIGIDDDFFELGGHSLKATSIAARINQELNLQMSLSLIFKNPTISELAVALEAVEAEKYTAIPKAKMREDYPLSPAQKRLFWLNELKPDSLNYNMPAVLTIEGELDFLRFQETFDRLIARHAVLRTSFKLVAGEPRQVICSDVDFHVDYREAEGTEIESLIAEFIRPFKLAVAPLFRVSLVKISNKYLFMFDLHHIISDGISMNILVREFAASYAGEDLPEIALEYVDYAVWQNQLLESGVLQQQEEYWLANLCNFIYTRLPGKISGTNAEKLAEIQFSLPTENDNLLDLYCIKHQLTRFACLFAIFNLAIYYEIEQTDLTIGIPIAGRKQRELENVLGLFLNVLAIRTKFTQELNFREYVNLVQETLLVAQENQDYPFDELYMRFKEKFGYKHDELFSVLFNYLPGEMRKEYTMQGIQLKAYGSEATEAKFDVVLYVREYEEGLRFNLVYKAALYPVEIMTRLKDNLINTLTQVLFDDMITLGELALRPGEESIEFAADFTDDFDNNEFFM